MCLWLFRYLEVIKKLGDNIVDVGLHWDAIMLQDYYFMLFLVVKCMWESLFLCLQNELDYCGRSHPCRPVRHCHTNILCLVTNVIYLLLLEIHHRRVMLHSFKNGKLILSYFLRLCFQCHTLIKWQNSTATYIILIIY